MYKQYPSNIGLRAEQKAIEFFIYSVSAVCVFADNMITSPFDTLDGTGAFS